MESLQKLKLNFLFGSIVATRNSQSVNSFSALSHPFLYEPGPFVLCLHLSFTFSK